MNERWIHVEGYDIPVTISNCSGYCYPTKNANASCPVYGDNCKHILRTDKTEERVLQLAEYAIKLHLMAAHKA